MKKWMVKIIVLTVLIITYIFPTGILIDSVDPSYTLPKFLFLASVCFVYLFCKIDKFDIIFFLFILLLIIITRNINFINFVSLGLIRKIVPDKDYVNSYLKNSSILYFCLFFTLVYSVLFIVTNQREGRYAFAAIKEINQSGLSIFCLGCLMKIKNKSLSRFVLLFGLLTFSRSYYLAIFCLIFFRIIEKSNLNKFFRKRMSYGALTIISSVALILLGLFYIQQYKNGNIIMNDSSSRLFTFLDYSNYFRFQTIIVLLSCYLVSLRYFVFGIDNETYIKLGNSFSVKNGIPYKGTPPHNLFFSHLKVYGLFAIFEIFFVSKSLKKVIKDDNTGLFFALALYSIFLGAGFYSYWLYLSIFSLMVYRSRNGHHSIKRSFY